MPIIDIAGIALTLASAAAETLTPYVNGEQTSDGSQITGWEVGEGKALVQNQFQFGSCFSQKNDAYGVEICNITVWNAALNSGAVKSLIGSETATDTLSLLALRPPLPQVIARQIKDYKALRFNSACFLLQEIHEPENGSSRAVKFC